MSALVFPYTLPVDFFGYTMLGAPNKTAISVHIGCSRTWNASGGFKISDGSPDSGNWAYAQFGHIERSTAGTYDWSSCDIVVQTFTGLNNDGATFAGGYNVPLIFTLGDIPVWAGSPGYPNYGGPADGSGNSTLSAVYIQNFFSAFLSRYAVQIQKGLIWLEDWNEPNYYGTWWNGTPAQLAALVSTLNTMYRAAGGVKIISAGISSGWPSNVLAAPVIGAESAPAGVYVDWLDQYLIAGGAAGCDEIGFHSYPHAGNFGPVTYGIGNTLCPEVAINIIANVRAVANQNGLGALPISATETAFLNIAFPTGPYSENQLIAFCPLYILIHAAKQVRRMLWFSPDDNTSTFGAGTGFLNSTNPWDRNGLTPWGRAVQVMLAVLAGSTFTTDIVRSVNSNQLNNPTFSGAIAGGTTQYVNNGTLPTGVGMYFPDVGSGATQGMSTQVVGSGVEVGSDGNSYNYLDFRIWGTPGAGCHGSGKIVLQPTTALIATSVGKTWTTAGYFAKKAGTLTNVLPEIIVAELDGSGNQLGTLTIGAIYTPRGAINDGYQQFYVQNQNANVQNTAPTVNFQYISGTALDITVRISGMTFDSGTTYTCKLTKPSGWQGIVAWDVSGKITQYAVPSGYAYYMDMEGRVWPITGATVSVTKIPIVLMSAPLGVGL